MELAQALTDSLLATLLSLRLYCLGNFLKKIALKNANRLVIEALFFDTNSTFKKWKHYSLLRILTIPLFFMVPLARYFLNYHNFKQVK